MKIVPLFRRALILVLVLASAGSVGAQSAATGTIEGRVFDTRRGQYLEKARVTVEGSRQETLTDAIGQYRLSEVPAGKVTLKIFYTGRGSLTEVVTVAPGETVQRDFTFAGETPPTRGNAAGDTIKLDAFNVSSSKQMDASALAINEQRFAKNITNVVSADEFGTIADGSVGEFMKFLPGITSDYTGGDARRFSISGVPAGNVPISMGGFDMASAAGGGTTRAVELDQVSINNVSRVEVNRSPTPEQPGSALAGSVNFVPRSAFERNRPAYNYSVAFLMKDAERAFLRQTPGPGWGEKTYKIHPGFDVSAIVPVNKNFGFTVSAGYSMQYTPQSNQSTQWRGAAAVTNAASTVSTGLPDTTPDKPYLTNYSWRDSGKDTTRYSFATTVDWRFAPRDRLSFGFSYAYLREHFATRTQNITINRVAPGGWGPQFTRGVESTFPTTGAAINAGQIELVNNGRIRPGRTIMPTLTWRHEGPLWKLDSGLSYSTSRIVYQDIDDGAFNSFIGRRTNVTIRFDDIFYLRPGSFTVTDPDGNKLDPSNLNNYSIVSANSIRQKAYETRRQAFGNVRRDFVVRDIPVTLKSGLDIRTVLRDRRGTSGELYNYVGADGRASTTPTTQAGLINDDSPVPFFDEVYSTRIPDFGLPKQQQVDNGKLWQGYRANPTHWTRSPTADYTNETNNSNRVQEIISSGYFRADAAFFSNRLKLTTGLRAEQTNINAQGVLNDPTRNFRRDAAGAVVKDANGIPLQIINSTTDPLGALQRTLVDRGYTAKKEFLRLFPSINLGYNLTENLIVRGAYYQTVGRPEFTNYVSGVTLPNTENPPSAGNRITLGNVNLKAWQAESYVARLEYYFPQGGQISVGAFIRDYKDAFVATVARPTDEFLATYALDPDTYGEYDVSTNYNNPNNVRMHGLEFDYQQPLTFLPHWARGMRFFVNASSQRAKESYDQFLDMNPFVANFGLSITRPKWNLRINENYRGIQRRAAIIGRSIEPGTYNYRPKRLYIDISGEYFLTRQLGLFVALRNFNGTTEDQKTYGPNTPAYAKFRQRDDYGGSLWTAGIKGTF
ncbi:MAG: carboxypeptidase regulatory-like domain-containing protein [Undibacterium sp.]|nr:carboxypeptidase regulatory-like domain-containing protein [Opitutaceae bacterium]